MVSSRQQWSAPVSSGQLSSGVVNRFFAKDVRAPAFAADSNLGADCLLSVSGRQPFADSGVSLLFAARQLFAAGASALLPPALSLTALVLPCG